MIRRALLAGSALAWLLPAGAFGQTPSNFHAETGKPISSSEVDRTFATKRDIALFPTPQDFVPAPQAAALASSGMDAGAAIAAAWAKGGARLPCGTYRLDAPLAAPASNTALLGEAAGCTRILVNFAAGDAIALTGLSNVRIEGVQFIAQGVRASGALIHITGGSNNTVANLRADGGGGQWADVVVIDGGSIANVIDHFYFSGASGDCVRVAGYAVDTYLQAGNTAACGTGVHIRSASGVYPINLDLVGSSGSGVLIDPAAGDNVNAVRGSNVHSDTSAGPGVLVTGTGSVSEIDLVGLWASDSGTSGAFTAQQALNMPMAGVVLDNPNIDGVQLTALRAKGNGAEGVDVRQGRTISLIGPQTLMNGASYGVAPPGGGAASTMRYPGIRIRGAADFVSVTAPISGAGGVELRAGQTPKQSYGLLREAGTGGKTVTVTGGQWPGNVTGSYQLGAASGDHIVDGGNQP